MQPLKLPQLRAISVLAALLFLSATIPAQKPGQPDCKPDCKPNCIYRFVVYGDTRNSGSDSTDGVVTHQLIAEKVVASRPMFVLQTGDLVFYGGEPKQWIAFDQIIQAFFTDNDIDYFPARGNHDRGGNGYEDRVAKYQKRAKESVRGGGNSLYYAFDVGPVRFIAIDTETLSGAKTDPQFVWLGEELQRAKDDKKFVIPFFHKAIYSIGAHWEKKEEVQASLEMRKTLEDLFKPSGVKLVFQGHDHLYYHTTRAGIVYVVAGGGGAPLNVKSQLHKGYGCEEGKDRPENHCGDEKDKYELAYNFLVCDVYPDHIAVTPYFSSDGKSFDTDDKFKFTLKFSGK